MLLPVSAVIPGRLFVTELVTGTIRNYGKYFFKIAEKVDGYTTRPLKTHKLAGRGPDGRIHNKYLGGGIKMDYFMVDHQRSKFPADEENVLKERVIEIRSCHFRSGYIALVANGEQKRWIIASKGMEVGDVVKTSLTIPRNPVRADPGRIYPLGAIPENTKVCCVEKLPNKGAFFARAAGVSATIVRKYDDRVIIRLPSRREVDLSNKCMCTIGEVSNPEWINRVIGSPNASRRLGFRPRSGLWQKKTGYHGRKIKGPGPTIKYETEPRKPFPWIKFTFESRPPPFRQQVTPLGLGCMTTGRTVRRKAFV